MNEYYNGMGSAMAPYPSVNNALPNVLPHNYMIPSAVAGVGAVAAPAADPNQAYVGRMYIVMFLAGLAIGGIGCWKAKPYYDKFKMINDEMDSEE